MGKGKYQEWLENDSLLLIKSWARDGLTDEEIARNIGISTSTFYEWCKRFTEFSETIKKARKPVAVEVEDTFFEKKLQGYIVKETTKEVTIAPNGAKTQHIKEAERYIPPDTTAMIFFLKNRMPDKYRDKPNTDSNKEVLDKLDDVLKDIKGVK